MNKRKKCTTLTLVFSLFLLDRIDGFEKSVTITSVLLLSIQADGCLCVLLLLDNDRGTNGPSFGETLVTLLERHRQRITLGWDPALRDVGNF